jgi:hypothetical protein
MTRMCTRLLAGFFVLFTLLGPVSIPLANSAAFEITVTNLARGSGTGDQCRVGMAMGLFLFATHRSGLTLFTPGEPASGELATLAESGAPFLLAQSLATNPRACRVITVPDISEFPANFDAGVVCPGESLTVTIDAPAGCDHISLAAMFFPSNDAFVALNGERGPSEGRRVFYVDAWDAGSEENDQLCVNIPGPPPPGRVTPNCRTGDANTNRAIPDPNPTAGEGYVHIHSGIHGAGEVGVQADGNLFPIRIGEEEFDWRNPIGRVVVRRSN